MTRPVGSRRDGHADGRAQGPLRGPARRSRSVPAVRPLPARTGARAARAQIEPALPSGPSGRLGPAQPVSGPRESETGPGPVGLSGRADVAAKVGGASEARARRFFCTDSHRRFWVGMIASNILGR